MAISGNEVDELMNSIIPHHVHQQLRKEEQKLKKQQKCQRLLVDRPCKIFQHVATCFVRLASPCGARCNKTQQCYTMLREMLHPFDQALTKHKNPSTKPLASLLQIRLERVTVN